MPTQAPHPSVKELKAFSNGHLSNDAAAIVESHIGECQPCCETLLGLSDADTFVGLLQQTERPVDSSMSVDMQSVQTMQLSSEESIKRTFAQHPRYRIVERIARGGMGDVFKAEHRSMGRTVALKVINQRLIENVEVVERFHREVRTAARLSHPNIVTAYDAEQAENIHFLVMEYVDGVNLATLVKETGSLSVAKACDYVRQAATGLQYAHEQGIVHRDIKPHNLMLTSMETVKILDFGLATLTEGIADPVDDEKTIENASLTAVGSIMGTPDFISPEQAANAHLADIRSDIYSLGATLYFLLSGQPPFATGSVAERLEMHAASEPLAIRSLRSDVSEELSDVISRMMAKDPDERFQIPLDVARALGPYVVAQVQPIETTSQTQSSRGGGSWWPMSPATTFVSAAAAALVLILGAIVYVETDKGTLVIDSVDDTVKVIISQGRDEAGSAYLKTIVIDTVTGSEVVRLASGEYKLSLGNKENEFEANQGGFTLRRGSNIVVKVTRKESKESRPEPKSIPPMTLPAMEQTMLANKVFWLTEAAAKELQAKADSDPNDIESRIQLLGFYHRKSILSKQLRESHHKLACWFIENYPDSKIAGDHAAHVMGTIDPIGYVKARELWLDAVRSHDQNIAVLVNAANFFRWDDRDKSEELLIKAQVLQPDNIDLTKRLASLYTIGRFSGDSASKRWGQANKLLVQLERKLSDAAAETDVSDILADLAKASQDVGLIGKAKDYADRLLKTSSTSDSIYAGNQVLGWIALKAGDLDNAGKHLIASGNISGSPVLNPFGPGMKLAKELLEKGQKDAVLEYLELCGKFWIVGPTNPKNKLSEWKETVRADGVPDFGPISLSR